MARHHYLGWALRLSTGVDVMGNRRWLCPQCGATQDPDDTRTTEIVEPGKDSRIEYRGKIRPTYHDQGIIYDCLVCGYSWWGTPPEDPTPGGASITFLHPVTECDGTCEDRDCC